VLEADLRVQRAVVNSLSNQAVAVFMAAQHGGPRRTVRLKNQEDHRMHWKWLSEFRDFALKGNVVDLAVGVIIGAAFGKIVSALVENVLMPPIGFLLKGVDFKDLAINLGTAQTPVLIKYGVFLQTLIDFTIIALVLFLVIQGMITLKKRFDKGEAAAPPKPTQSEIYLKEIRDALVKK
jgi:large conductance mechanosensitive channel